MTRESLSLLDFFRLGGVLGLRTSSQQLPLVTRVINKFACNRVPRFGYTTFSIFNNVATGPHKDFHNAHLDNVIVSLGGFTGGGVWIQESGGSTPCPDDPSLLGRVLNFRNGTISFAQRPQCIQLCHGKATGQSLFCFQQNTLRMSAVICVRNYALLDFQLTFV